MLEFSELRKVLYDLADKHVRAIVQEYNIPTIKNGQKLLYNKAAAEKIKKDIEERYKFNRENYLVKSQLKEYNLPKYLVINLKKVPSINLDKIHEFKGSHEFYIKSEVEDLAKEREFIKGLLTIKEVTEIIGDFHHKQIKETLDHFGIKGIKSSSSNILKYDPKEIENLKKEVDELYLANREKYFTFEECLDLGCSLHELTLFQAIEPRPHERINEFKGLLLLYNKNDVLDRLADRNKLALTYSSKEVAELFGFTVLYSNEYLKKVGLSPVEIAGINELQWNKNEIDELYLKVTSLYEYYCDNFWTKIEFEKTINISLAKLVSSAKKLKLKVGSYDIPVLIRFGRFYRIQKVFAIKEIIDVLEKLYDDLDEKQICLVNELVSSYKLKHSETQTQGNIIQPYNEKEITDIANFIKTSNSFTYNEFLIQLEKYYSNTCTIKDLIISEQDILEKFDISAKKFIELVKTISLAREFKFKSTNFYSLQKIEETFNTLIQQQKELLSKYITSSEIQHSILSLHICSNIRVDDAIPSYLKFGILRYQSGLLYDRSKFEELHYNQLKVETIEKYRNEIENTTLPGKLFLELLEALDNLDGRYSFNYNLQETQDMWKKYVERKINKSRGNFKTIGSLYVSFVNLTELLIDLVVDKELSKWTTNDINLKILNAEVSVYQRLELKIFVEYLSRKKAVNYNIKKLIDVSKLVEAQKVHREKESYNITVFVKLLDYVTNIELHKKEALNDLLEQKKGRVKYKEYASTWLYILIHLNNAWRSNDVVEKIPRITLPPLIKNINDFKQYHLDHKEIDSVVWELASKVIGVQHNKNSKDAYFFFSTELKEALANALVLCELKCQIERPTSNHLIHLDSQNQLNTTLNNRFFKHFEIKGFVFKSLAANRSFITFVNRVLKKKTNRNPLEVTQLLRNHSSQDVTDIYNEISPQHLNRVAAEVFNTGYFGYNYQLLLNSIFEDTSQQTLDTTEQIHLVKGIFGSIYKIENLANQLADLEYINPDLSTYLNESSLEEKVENLYLIGLEQLPAKQKFWQCMLGNCLYINRQCEACPFAVPHMYALTRIVTNLETLIEEYENLADVESLIGEKRRVTNLIYRNLKWIKSAKDSFGEHVIEAFLGYKYTLFKEKVSNLKDFYPNLTIERK